MKNYASVKIDGNNYFVRRHSGSPRGLYPCSRIFILADSRNSNPHKVRGEFLEEVILMDNTNQYGIDEIPQEIRGFLDELLRDANMTSLDQKTHDDMLIELYTRLDDYMIGTIMEKLPQDKMEEFTKMAEGGKTRDELQKYLQDNIPNATEIFANAMVDFRNLYLGNVADARNKAQKNTGAANANNE